MQRGHCPAMFGRTQRTLFPKLKLNLKGHHYGNVNNIYRAVTDIVIYGDRPVEGDNIKRLSTLLERIGAV